MSQKVVPRNLEKYPRDPEFRILRRVILKAFLETWPNVAQMHEMNQNA